MKFTQFFTSNARLSLLSFYFRISNEFFVTYLSIWRRWLCTLRLHW